MLSPKRRNNAVSQHRPRRAFEIGITDLGMNDVDEFLMNLGIVDARKLAAHQLRRVDRNVIGENAPRFLRPDLDRPQRQLAFVKIEIERMVKARWPFLTSLPDLAKLFRRQRLAAQYGFS